MGREAYKQNITKSYEEYKATFKTIANNYNAQIFKITESIHQKVYGLRDHSMTQRAMVMALFIDYCDALYYHSFTECGPFLNIMPDMADEFGTITDKLLELKWNLLVTTADMHPAPTTFDERIFYIKDEENLVNGSKPNFIIENLRNKSETEFNLMDHTGSIFKGSSRVRIDYIAVHLMDANRNPIKIPDSGLYVKIYFPTMFIDRDRQQNSQYFLGRNKNCYGDYWSDGTDIMPMARCEQTEEFSETSYKPTPDGLFKVKIENPEVIANMADVHMLEVVITGSDINNVKKQAQLDQLALDYA